MATKAKPTAKAVKKATEVTSKKKTTSASTTSSKTVAKKAVAPSKPAVVAKKAAKVVEKPTKKVEAKVVKPSKIEKPVKSDSKTNSKIVTKKTTKSEPKVEAPIKKSASKKVEAPAKKETTAKKVVTEPKKETPSKKAVPTTPEVKKAEAPKKAEPVKKVEVEPAPALPKKETAAKKAAKKNTVTVIKTTTLKSSTAAKPASAIPTPSNRPAITRSAIRDEKKPNVVIAHRRLDNKAKKEDESGKTMINYQPDYTRSILDTPVEQQGPVYRYSDEELNEFKELINSRLEAARKELSYLQALIMRKDETGTEDTENRYMNMEDGSGAMEREQLSQLASRQIQFTSHLEKALIRIESKTYGICRVTGKLIDKARLRAVPHATLSIEAKNTMTKK